MKPILIGGGGLIGSKIVAVLRHGGHEVIAASPKVGLNTITAMGRKKPWPAPTWVIDPFDSLSFDLMAVLYGTLLNAKTNGPPTRSAFGRRYPRLSNAWPKGISNFVRRIRS